MRAAIITLSAIAAVALVVLGGLLNALSGFGFDVAAPYNEPSRVVATFIGDAPGLGLALTALGIALWAAARASAQRWFIGLLVWPLFPALAASLMFAGALADPDFWFLPLALIPLAPLLFAIVSPPKALSPAGGQTADAQPLRFGVFAGVLAVIVVGGVVLLYPSQQSPSAGSGGAPGLNVTQGSFTADCANGAYPPVTLTNIGSQPLTWTAASQDTNVTASPGSDSLAPNGSEQVTLSGKTTATDVIVQFHVGGGEGGVAKFACQPAVGT